MAFRLFTGAPRGAWAGWPPSQHVDFQISCASRRSDASADAAAAAKMLAKRFELQKVSSSLESKAGIGCSTDFHVRECCWHR